MGAAGRFCSAFVALLAAVMALSTTAAADVGGAEITHLLNLQREANGIPGGLVERPDWSAACAKHNYYQAQTGEFGHSENPSSPFYSAEGDWAAHNSVLSGGYPWAEGNPWENAPIHLIQLLAPALSEIGAAETGHFNCATTWPGYKRPSPGSVTAYSYPGNGVSGVVPTEYAAESPFIPGDFVGLPEGTATGRYLLAYLAGVPAPDASEVSATASLTSAAGAVELRVIDSTHSQIGSYMPRPSAFLIPAQPLQSMTNYEAVVHWTATGAPLTEQRFSFKTGTDPGEGALPAKDEGSSACSREAKKAQALRQRSAHIRLRATRLSRAASSKAERRRARRLRTRSVRLKREARHSAKQAKLCREKG